jgi:hypothetical protein
MLQTYLDEGLLGRREKKMFNVTVGHWWSMDIHGIHTRGHDHGVRDGTELEHGTA